MTARRAYAGALCVATGYAVARWAMTWTASVPGYGRSSAATGGDPLALLIGLLVGLLAWKMVRRVR